MSQKTQAILFDADGVVINRDHYFSVQLAKDLGISESEINKFFQNVFQLCVIGRADLKETLKPWLVKWKWDKSVDSLLQYWFQVEDVSNQELIQLIHQLKSDNIFCCLATNQEKYRSAYLFENMGFGKLFDHCFFSCEIKAKKPQTKYWEYVWDSLLYLIDVDSKSQVMFWDDSPRNIEAAGDFGFDAHLFENNKQFIQELSKSSIDLQP